MDGKSLDIKQEKIDRLKEIMPEVFTEGDKIDIEKLKETLGEDINTDNERYVLNWAGKNEAFKVLQTPTTATLAPDKEESVNFDTTENIFIEGENLEVLKVLQKSYYGKIKMIYIDPPYNTGNDSFIYPDKFSETKEEYLKRIGEKDEEGYLLKEGLFRKNSKDNGHYHSNWLNMMYPRLFLARNLLRDDGVIFVSIDDNEVHNLKLIMNEIFGEENFIAQIVWEKRYGRSNDVKLMSSLIDHILLYRKTDTLKLLRENRGEINNTIYSNPDNDPRGNWASVSFVSQRTKEERPNLSYSITNPFTGEIVDHPINSWKYSLEKFKLLQKDNRLYWGKDGKQKYPRIKRFLSELPQGLVPINLWKHKEVGTGEIGTREVEKLIGKEVFTFPKPTTLINRMIQIGMDEESIVLDFFAGSGSTGHAIYEANKQDGGNRKFILIQLPEETDKKSEANKKGLQTISSICRKRLERATNEMTKEAKDKRNLFANEDIDLGFKFFKLKYSNFKLWRGDIIENGDELTKQIEVFENPVKEGTEEDNILYELLLKSGYELTAKVEKQGDFYIVNDEFALALTKIDDKTIKNILKIKPKKCIVLDKLFSNNDELKTNTVLQMRDAGIEFKTV